jgi:anti-sigma B factor antagonist
VLVVAIAGEVDMSNFGVVQREVDDLIGDHMRVIVDLGALSFMDSSGIAVFVQVANRVDALEVRNPTEIVRRIIEVCGLADVFHLLPS